MTEKFDEARLIEGLRGLDARHPFVAAVGELLESQLMVEMDACADAPPEMAQKMGGRLQRARDTVLVWRTAMERSYQLSAVSSQHLARLKADS